MTTERQTQVLRAQLISKAVLRPDEAELYELTQLAGITVDPEIFKILLDLLKMNVPPAAIIQTLRSMCSPHSEFTDRQEDSYRAYPLSRGGGGEPHMNVTSQSDILAQRRHDVLSSDQYRSARSVSGERRGVPDRSSAELTGNSGGSHHTSSILRSRGGAQAVGEPSGASGSRFPSDSQSSQQRQRAQQAKGRSGSSSYMDSFVTTRSKNSTTDGSSDRLSKKRHSYR